VAGRFGEFNTETDRVVCASATAAAVSPDGLSLSPDPKVNARNGS